MAKKKQEKETVIDCKECRYSILQNNQPYCKTKMKDDNTFQEYAKVNLVKDCLFFRI